MFSLLDCVCGKSSSAPETFTPILAKVWLASSSAWARRHPGLGGDAADRDARAADAGLLDQYDVGAQLGRADGGRVSPGPAAQDGDITLHRNSLLGIASEIG